MKVLIVAKTRQGSGACIGGITFEGHSVRLIAADAAFNEHVGLEYVVGEVWELDATPADQVIPPHVENIVVRSKRRLGPMTDPVPFIEAHMPPVVGGADLLYEGLAQAAPIRARCTSPSAPASHHTAPASGGPISRCNARTRASASAIAIPPPMAAAH